MKRFVFLDRDGTINVERHSLSSPEEMELLAGAAEGIRMLAQMGLGAVVVTDQSGLAKGYFVSATLDRIHARLREMLADGGRLWMASTSVRTTRPVAAAAASQTSGSPSRSRRVLRPEWNSFHSPENLYRHLLQGLGET